MVLDGGLGERVPNRIFNSLMAAAEARQVEMIKLFSRVCSLGSVDGAGRNAFDVYFSKPESTLAALREMVRMTATDPRHVVSWPQVINECLRAGHVEGLGALLDAAPKETWIAKDLMKKLCSVKRDRAMGDESAWNEKIQGSVRLAQKILKKILFKSERGPWLSEALGLAAQSGREDLCLYW